MASGNRVTNKISQKVKRLDREVVGWTRRGVRTLKAEVNRLILLPKTGRKGKKRTASAAGEPWAKQDGDTFKSFSIENKINSTKFGSALARAKGLEEGYSYTSKKAKKVVVDARPTLKPALKNIRPALRDDLKESVKRANKK